MTIAAKPTLYADTRFRSRLEARWAVFFDALGIREWVYEPLVEGAPSGYLPDFDIGSAFVEVKPENWLPTSVSERGRDEWNEAHDRDFRRWEAFVIATDPKRLHVYFGEPGRWVNGRLVDLPLVYIFDPKQATPAQWGECGVCGSLRVVPVGEAICGCPQVYSQLTAAINAARDTSYLDAP